MLAESRDQRALRRGENPRSMWVETDEIHLGMFAAIALPSAAKASAGRRDRVVPSALTSL